MTSPTTKSLLSPPVLLSFGAVYFLWGSTFLAILIGIETVPPFLLAATRFLLAGAVLYGFLRWRGAPRPTLGHWKSALLLGSLMMFGGNGLVTWAEKLVPSGLAALLVATVPVWMVLLDATVYRKSSGTRYHALVWVGLLLAVGGVAVLPEPGEGVVDPVGAFVLILASFLWANGSLLNRTADVPASPFMAAAPQMLAGGGVLLLAATLAGEWSALDLAAVSGRSFAALLYLAIAGSIVTHSAYVYLLRVQSAAAVSTYAFVNPIVALGLGWLVGEALGARALIGAALVAGAVVLIHFTRRLPVRGRKERRAPALEPRALGLVPSALAASELLSRLAGAGEPVHEDSEAPSPIATPRVCTEGAGDG